jgi:hypothetical protein
MKTRIIWLGLLVLGSCAGPPRYVSIADGSTQNASHECWTNFYRAHDISGAIPLGLIGGAIGGAVGAAAGMHSTEPTQDFLDRCMTEHGYAVRKL